MNEKKEVDVLSKKRPTVNELKTEVIRYAKIWINLMLVLIITNILMRKFLANKRILLISVLNLLLVITF